MHKLHVNNHSNKKNLQLILVSKHIQGTEMTDQYSVLLKVPTGDAAFITENVFYFLVFCNNQYEGFPEIQSQSH